MIRWASLKPSLTYRIQALRKKGIARSNQRKSRKSRKLASNKQRVTEGKKVKDPLGVLRSMVSDRDKKLIQCRKLINSLKDENKHLNKELLAWQKTMEKLTKQFDRGVTFNNNKE